MCESQAAHDARRLKAVEDTVRAVLVDVPGDWVVHERHIWSGYMDEADAAGRLRALLTKVVSTAFQNHAPDWLSEALWEAMVAETPKPEQWRRASAHENQETLL